MNIQKGWSDAYQDLNFNQITPKNLLNLSDLISFVERYIPSSTNQIYHYFKNCDFLSIKNNGKGGAILFTGINEGKVLIERSYFCDCMTLDNSQGGGIYFSQYGYIKLLFVCSDSCKTGASKTGYWGQFCYLLTQNEYFSTTINQTSILHTINSYGYIPVHFQSGNHYFQSSNCSNNNIYHIQCIYFYNINISFTKYSSFENN
jgi:hypothetical protein